MNITSIPSSDPARNLRELCFAGDWACSQGDLGTLHYVAKRLVALVPEALRSELLAVAAACRHEPERATSSWYLLKPRLLA